MTKENRLPLSEEERDQAVAYVLGWLGPQGQNQYQETLQSGTSEMEYLDDLRQLVGMMGSMAPHKTPPVSLKRKLFARLDEMESKELAYSEKQLPEALARAIPGWCAALEWDKTAMPGIRRKILFEDKSTTTRGMLLNITPGSQYPSHRHNGPEYFFIIEGAILIDDLDGGEQFQMVAGDFQRSLSGSCHGRLSSPEGCFALVISSTKDEILEDLHIG